MKRNKNNHPESIMCWLVGWVALLVAFSTYTCLSAAAQVRYTVTDLGTLGGTFSLANGVNSRGQVGGGSTLAGDTTFRAFLWQNGVMTDIGTLGGTFSFSLFMNLQGQQAGFSSLPGEKASHAFRWTNGVMTDLGTLGGTNSVGNGINSQGHVVGASDTPNSGGNPAFCLSSSQCHAFLWINGVMADLGTLPGGANSQAFMADDLDRVVGESDTTFHKDHKLGFPPFHATLWVNGVPNDLGTLGGKLSVAFQGNNMGQVIGASDLAGDTNDHAFLWENGVMQDLGTFPGDQDSEAFVMNNQGQVVGVSGTFPLESVSLPFARAVLWQDGVISDLNALIPADSGLKLLLPLGIDPVGHIVGAAIENSTGEIHGFLLTPTTQTSATGMDVTPAQPAATSKVLLPEGVLKLLRQQLGFLRFGARLLRPQ